MRTKCVECGSFIVESRQRRHAKFCTNKCRDDTYSRDSGLMGRTDISKGSVGALAELAVSSDLLGRGYDVFRSVSPNAKCDLILLNGAHQCVRIEVTTGYRNRANDRVYYATHNKERFDILAVYVSRDGEIVYMPEDLP